MVTDPQTQGTKPGMESTTNSHLITKLSTLTKPIWNLLLYSSAYLALIAAAEVVLVSKLLSVPLSPAPVVAGLLTFAVYGNDRLADIETDAKTAPARTAFVRQYQDSFYVLAAIAYGLAVALSVFGGPLSFGLSLLPGAIWILYAYNWIPRLTEHTQRLKDIFILNSVLVAVAWSLVIVFLPLLYVDSTLSPAVGVVFLFFVLATFVNTEIPNVRDMDGDREIGVRTLPVVVGIRWTKYILYGITVLTAVILVAAVGETGLSVGEISVLVASLLFLIGVIFCLNRIENDGALAIAAECTRVPALVLAGIPLLG